MHPAAIALTCACALAVAGSLAPTAFAQGALTPPSGAPAPTQKSLQEIWDKLTALDAQTEALASDVADGVAADLAGFETALRLLAPERLPWVITTIDADVLTYGAFAIGTETSLAFGPDGHPAVAYLAGEQLRFARFDGTSWQITDLTEFTVSGPDYPSLSFGPDGHPAIAYTETRFNWVRVVRFDGTAWQRTTVEEYPGATFRLGDSSLRFGPDGQPVIAYQDMATPALKFARFNGTAWDVSIVSTAEPAGYAPQLALDPATGHPAIARFDTGSSRMSVSRFDGTQWVTTPVSVGGVPHYVEEPAIAFAGDGELAIAFNATSQPRLQLARPSGASWTFTTVDAAAGAGLNVSLAYGREGQPFLAYYENAGTELRVASLLGGSWHLQILDAAGDTGVRPSLAIAPDGEPAIAYLDVTDRALRFARRGLPRP